MSAALDQMVTFSGKVTRQPIVRPKVIFSSIETDGKILQVTLFRNKAPSHYAEAISNWELGQEVTVTGKLEDNPFNGQKQLVVHTMPGAPAAEETSTDTTTDANIITIPSGIDKFKDQNGRNWYTLPNVF